MAIAHVVALGAIWVEGRRGEGEPTREGGVILVSLVAEPMALPGEVPTGKAVGAGQPEVPIQPPAVAVESVAAVTSKPAPQVPPRISVEPGAKIMGAPPSRAAAALVTEVFIPPAFAVREEPAYPARARRAGVEGQVVVKVRLSAVGSVWQVELVSGSGSRLLDEAALAAAQGSSFTPAQRNGTAVEAEAIATYRFELR